MKKLARLTALLLTGVMLLLLASCGGASGGGPNLNAKERAAKTKLLEAINAKRVEFSREPIKENKVFSEAEEIMLRPFRDTQQTAISGELWRSANREANALRSEERKKLGFESKNYNTPEIESATNKAYLGDPLPKDDAALDQLIARCGMLDEDCVYIGLSVAEIKGEMYFSFCAFKKIS